VTTTETAIADGAPSPHFEEPLSCGVDSKKFEGPETLNERIRHVHLMTRL